MNIQKTVLKHFKVLASTKEHKEPYECKYCTKVQAKHTTRMVDHLLKTCKMCPLNVKDSLKRLMDVKAEIEKKYSSKTSTHEEEIENGNIRKNYDHKCGQYVGDLKKRWKAIRDYQKKKDEPVSKKAKTGDRVDDKAMNVFETIYLEIEDVDAEINADFLNKNSSQRLSVSSIADDVVFDVSKLDNGHSSTMLSHSTPISCTFAPSTSSLSKKKKLATMDEAFLKVVTEKTSAIQEMNKKTTGLHQILNSRNKSFFQRFISLHADAIEELSDELQTQCKKEVQTFIAEVVARYQDMDRVIVLNEQSKMN